MDAGRKAALFVPLTRNRPAINYEYVPVDWVGSSCSYGYTEKYQEKDLVLVTTGEIRPVMIETVRRRPIEHEEMVIYDDQLLAKLPTFFCPPPNSCQQLL